MEARSSYIGGFAMWEEIIVAVVSSSVSVFVWHNIIYPLLVRKLGEKPAKVIDHVVEDVRDEILKEDNDNGPEDTRIVGSTD